MVIENGNGGGGKESREYNCFGVPYNMRVLIQANCDVRGGNHNNVDVNHFCLGDCISTSLKEKPCGGFLYD